MPLMAFDDAPPDFQTLPNAIEAEQAVIGAILLNNSALERCQALQARHFFEPVHGRLFNLILELVAAGQLADFVTVGTRAQHETVFQEFGGAVPYLQRVARAAEAVPVVAHYAEAIIECWAKRELIALAQKIERDGYGGQRASAIMGELTQVSDQLQRATVAGERLAPVLPADFAPPDIPRLIHQFMYHDSIALIYGGYSSGKSFFTIDLACRLAAGMEWQSRAVDQGPVLYIAGEAGRSIQRRVQAWAKRNGVPLDGLPLGVVSGPCDLFSERENDTGRVISQAQAWSRAAGKPLRVVVIDTVHSVCPGSREDSADFGRFLFEVHRIRQALGCAVILVHHAGKDDQRGARGGNALPAAADIEIEIKEDIHARTVSIHKLRDGVKFEPLPFLIDDVVLRRDDDGHEIGAGVLRKHDPGIDPRAMRDERIAAAKSMRDDGANISEIARKLDLSRNTVRKYLDNEK